MFDVCVMVDFSFFDRVLNELFEALEVIVHVDGSVGLVGDR